jgi:protocatechuate 3,4-dioxygenase beta subunit
MKTEELSRRDLMKWGGAAVASISLGTLESMISGCKGASIQPDSGQQGAAPDECLQATHTTRGPYFVDHALDPNIDNDVVDPSIPERSDITTDTEGSAGKQAGLPLTLKLTIASYNGGACAPLSQARVDIWHCNAQGVYSDVQVGAPPMGGAFDGSPTAASTQGQNFLRGYQRTDANGQVTFTTIYPGSGARDTRNDTDMIYESENPPLLVNLTGSATTGYTGTATLGIQTGQIFGG